METSRLDLDSGRELRFSGAGSAVRPRQGVQLAEEGGQIARPLSVPAKPSPEMVQAHEVSPISRVVLPLREGTW